MGEIVRFERGCNGCKHLVKMDKNTYMCLERAHMDDSDVIPILNGEHTKDWNICCGSSYVRVQRHKSHTS